MTLDEFDALLKNADAGQGTPMDDEVDDYLAASRSMVPKMIKVCMRAKDVRLFALNMPNDVDRGEADELLDEAIADLEHP